MQQQPSLLFFDVNETLLDLDPVKKSVAAVLDGNTALVPLWFTTMLQYALVSTVSDQFRDFASIGIASMLMVAKKNGIRLEEAEARQALEPMLALAPYPEVKEALSQLQRDGHTLVALTNSSQHAMEQQLQHAGLSNYFEEMLSVERIGLYKPHQHVYRWAAYQMDTQIEDCMMVAAHGWDVAGAKWAGMRTAFIARKGQTQYPLAPEADLVADDLAQLSSKFAEKLH
jgi:2-haloacid dehalogenase